MAHLNVTIIDVGWGDSIFIDHEDAHGRPHYALVDSNDEKDINSTRMFIERYFRLKRREMPRPLFDFVLLTHPHDDHMQGLQGLMRRYGTKYFLHPKSNRLGNNAPLLRYCRRSSLVEQYDAAYVGKPLPPFGDVAMQTLWPLDGHISDDENNNSVVIGLTYGAACIVLTGDAEEEAWRHIGAGIPANTVFFKVPHHGSRNGSLDSGGDPTWLPHCPADAQLGISCMYRADYKHPHQEVLDAFTADQRTYYRTDEHYHLTVTLRGGSEARVKYSHV